MSIRIVRGAELHTPESCGNPSVRSKGIFKNGDPSEVTESLETRVGNKVGMTIELSEDGLWAKSEEEDKQ